MLKDLTQRASDVKTTYPVRVSGVGSFFMHIGHLTEISVTKKRIIRVGELTGNYCKAPGCGKPLVKKFSGHEPSCCDRKCAAAYSHSVRSKESYKRGVVSMLTDAPAKPMDVEVPAWMEQEVMA